MARVASWCPLPTRDHKTCVSLNQSLHQQLHSALLCQILPYTALLEIHRNTGFYSPLPGCISLSSAQDFDGIVGESLPVVGGRHVALGAAPHMTTFARLSPVSNSHPFDFLTPPPHTMSKQHMHEVQPQKMGVIDFQAIWLKVVSPLQAGRAYQGLRA